MRIEPMRIEQEMYSAEVSERVKSVNLSEIEKLTPEQRVWIENAYRRGFFQGAAAAIEGVERKMSYQSLEDWLYEDLLPWRYSMHDGKFEQPVWPGRNL